MLWLSLPLRCTLMSRLTSPASVSCLQVQQYKSAEQDASVAAMQSEALAGRLDHDLAAVRQRLVALEGGVKARDAELGRMAKQLDRSRSVEQEVAAKNAQVRLLLGEGADPDPDPDLDLDLDLHADIVR